MKLSCLRPNVYGWMIMLFLISAIFARAGMPKNIAPVSEADIVKIKDASPEKAAVKPAKPRKVLIFWLCGGFYHKSIPHINKALEVMGEKTGAFDAVFSKDLSVFSADKLKEFDGIIFNNTTRLPLKDPEQRKAIMDFIKGGKGIIGLHAASDNFYDWPEAAEMMGGLFDGHPWTGGGTWAMKLEEPGHVLNKAFDGKGFKVSDEIYRVKAPYSRENQRILMTLDLEDEATAKAEGKNPNQVRKDKDYAISWIRSFGKGRVFYCSFGHNNPISWNKPIMQHYLDGIQYALGDLEADDKPSAKK